MPRITTTGDGSMVCTRFDAISAGSSAGSPIPNPNSFLKSSGRSSHSLPPTSLPDSAQTEARSRTAAHALAHPLDRPRFSSNKATTNKTNIPRPLSFKQKFSILTPCTSTGTDFSVSSDYRLSPACLPALPDLSSRSNLCYVGKVENQKLQSLNPGLPVEAVGKNPGIHASTKAVRIVSPASKEEERDADPHSPFVRGYSFFHLLSNVLFFFLFLLFFYSLPVPFP